MIFMDGFLMMITCRGWGSGQVKDACREFGWYARCDPVRGWISCAADERGAQPDLNRLHKEAKWDRQNKRFVRKD
jgi:hypothetical protein